MITRFYYTLNELQDVEAQGGFNRLFLNWIGSFTDTTETIDCYADIENNFGDDFIAFLDVEHPSWEYVEKPTVAEIMASDEYRKQIIKFIKKMYAWVGDSQFRYEKLIKLYNAEADNLMNKVETISSTQFNDTPQTTVNGLDEDEYATTYTKNKSSTDISTVMARLQEIRNYWRSIYDEWVEEFASRYVIY